jgi:hypothetical protein
MYTRLNKSGQWMRDCGQSVNFWESSLEKRIQDVSSDGQNSSFVGGSDDVQITQGDALGFDATTQITYVRATGLMSFTVVSPDIQEILQPGDIIRFQLTGEAFSRAFMVISLASDSTCLVADWGITLLGDLAATVALSIQRHRHSDAEVLETGDADEQSIAQTALNVLSAADNNLPSSKKGDIQLLAEAANFTYHGYNVYQKSTAASMFGPSDNLATVVATAADNKSHTLRYHDSSVVRGSDLGFIEADANGHAVSIIAPAGGNEAILTITVNGTASAVPDVNNIFKVGDIIVCNVDQPAIHKRQYLIVAVDPSGNGRSLSVIGSSSIIAGGDAGDSLANYVRARIRHGGPSKVANALNSARQLTEFEIDWTPRCLSFFRLPHALPGGEYIASIIF